MQTFRTVWLLRDLSLDGKLCLRDDRSDASAESTRSDASRESTPRFISSPYLAVVNKHGRHHA